MASGALESIVINGRRFTCKADDDCEIELPGFSNETIVHGDGSTTYKKTRHTGHISGINLLLDNDRDDHEFLQEAQNSLEPLDISATEVDGTVYGGSMQLTEELTRSTGENSMGITLEGSLEKL